MAAHIESVKAFDSSKHLVLYSGGADSTLFIALNESARYLLHYSSQNTTATSIASHNAVLLNKFLNVATTGYGEKNGELSPVNGLYDVGMLVEAGIYAIRHGFDGLVVCFNKDDLGCDVKAIEALLGQYRPGFTIATPLLHLSQGEILKELGNHDLKFVSCMVDSECGWCGKCKRNTRIYAEMN